ncbi:hypothetical protein [Streptomyces sp. ME19-01-6]|uniref:hypothetical protein n=1 Tax=Streptomyces sp. ME19-01-6 TaxID=3028686 RepID=UPI0029BD7604|nr:hypothetical protein [Streptomyces sp. ME19-01-6]MDX3225016.1 hypothetical protein [Streptomyces sp. ME19-01-6]
MPDQTRLLNRPLTIRLCLTFLILEGAVIGVHALFFPRYFYEEFFLGAGWLKMMGPYSEHLTRDAGALYLGITVATYHAARRLTPDYVQGICMAQAVAAFPHMIYHIVNWRMSGFWQMIPQAGTLFITVVIALVGVVQSRRHEHETAATSQQRPAAAASATRR